MNFLCNRIGFPKEASDYVYSVFNGITHNKNAYEELIRAKTSFLSQNSKEYNGCIERIHSETGIHIYTINLVLILVCAKAVKARYDENGISEEVFFDSMSDITCKLIECKKMYNIWGVFVLDWYRGIFSLRTIKLGRLEYAYLPFPYDTYKGYVKKGENVFSCHIPSTGPLTPESVIDSLKRAYKFFGCTDKLIVYCHSWLIYPAHYELFPNGSNLRAFYDLFNIIDEEQENDNRNLWRIFYKPNDTPFDDLPENTTLQRNFKKYLKEGNYIGVGIGMLVFDGENFVK